MRLCSPVDSVPPVSPRLLLLAALLALALALGSCAASSGGGGSGGADAGTDGGSSTGDDGGGNGGGSGEPSNAPVLDSAALEPVGRFVVTDDTLVFDFSTSMDPESLVLDGDLADAAEAAWEDHAASNDRLVLSPGGGAWPVGQQTLTLQADSAEGVALAESFQATFKVAHGTWYFVDLADGNDGNDGTSPAAPFATLHAAFDAAPGIGEGGTGIAVTGGGYLFDSVSDFNLTLPDGAYLLGSFDATFDRPDLEGTPTVISNESSDSGPIHTLKVLAGATPALVEAVVLESGDGSDNSTVLEVNGGKVTLRNCILNGGNAGANAYAVLAAFSAFAPTVQVQDCVINGGDGDNTAYAVNQTTGSLTISDTEITSGTATGDAQAALYGTNLGLLEISGSQLDGGSGNNPNGVTLSNVDQGSITGSHIRAGSGSSGNTSALYGSEVGEVGSPFAFTGNVFDGGSGGSRPHLGLWLLNSTAELTGNAIYAGEATGNAWGLRVQTSTVTVEDNDIHGGSATGLYERGLELEDSSAEILGNRIYGGEQQDNIVFGIHVDDNSTATVADNLVHGGTTMGTGAIGIYTQSPISIERNIVFGGEALDNNGYTMGIHLDQVAADTANYIRNNVVHGGVNAFTYSGGVPEQIIGVRLNNSSSKLFNNTIYAASTVSTYTVEAIELNINPSTQETAIYNNLLVSTDTCLKVASTLPDQILNTLFDCPTFWDNGSTTYDTIADLEANSTTNDGAGGNVDDAPDFVENALEDGSLEDIFSFVPMADWPFNRMELDTDFHLSASAAANLREGGITIAAGDYAFTGDLDGTTRTGCDGTCDATNTGAYGWTLGAYELD